MNSPLTFVCASILRDPGPAGGAAEMPGSADRSEGSAPPGPAGLLPQEVRNRDGVFPKPGKTG